ncbi:uncharacterized protein FIBRA_06354 [Fibroporia radiculosa]|uniref:Cas1p 10 TM acyl transferase domain-containing protein n=1 Tax=Fibroporia radiculosa TaxID=599839 RepID=J4GB83_9APHY|nr:uncharacterized protein FIBRA_06354 [Fibroporia radiculosa]CCM04188.1 predicted protein [Fibroporia radiculosa]
MGFMNLPAVPSDLKSISPYLQRADELSSKDPVVSYWCAYYAAQSGISLRPKEPPSRAFLLSLLSALEKLKVDMGPNEAIEDEAVASAYVENFALKVFAMADNEDRRNEATRCVLLITKPSLPCQYAVSLPNALSLHIFVLLALTASETNSGTAKKFLAAANFLELLRIFDKEKPDTLSTADSNAEKIRYSKWKAADIAKAFREGRKPNPGPAEPEPPLASNLAAQPPSGPSTPALIRATQPPPTIIDMPPPQQDSFFQHVHPDSSVHSRSRSHVHDAQTPGAWSTIATPGTPGMVEPEQSTIHSRSVCATVSEELEGRENNADSPPLPPSASSSSPSRREVRFTPSVVGGLTTPPPESSHAIDQSLLVTPPTQPTTLPRAPPAAVAPELRLPPGFLPETTVSDPPLDFVPDDALHLPSASAPPLPPCSLTHTSSHGPLDSFHSPGATSPHVFLPPPPIGVFPASSSAPVPPVPPPFVPVPAPAAATVTTLPVELTPVEIARAQKHCRFAISSLDYEDVEQARKELRAALKMLGGILQAIVTPMPPKRFSFSLNPQWSHYVALFSLAIALFSGFVRYFIIDHTDPLHCDALLNEGQWLDSKFKNWQPDGCMMHTYQAKDVTACMGSRRVVFIGDSVTRQLYFQFAHIVDPSLPTAPPDDERKHQNYSFTATSNIQLSFYWDPYLNSSEAQSYIIPQSLASSTPLRDDPTGSADRPALLVLGSGLWYLRYANEGSGGLPAWEDKIASAFDALASARTPVADKVVVLPIEDVVSTKLSRERAQSMQAPDIDAMNSDLHHHIRPAPLTSAYALFPASAPTREGKGRAAAATVPAPLPVSLPLVFNKMLDASQTEDGLHFSDALVTVQANILLNLRCNDVLPKTFPLDKTCCRRYPVPSPLHSLVLVVAVLWGPACVLLSRRLESRIPGQPFIGEPEMPAVVLSVVAALIYISDRTGFWLKEQKQFSPWIFTFLSVLSLIVGLLTVRQADNDLGFLNREQTDEWKGWMQIAILIYHYTGASKISGIYNVIRVLVAAYLYMTGYGHVTYYVKKADFGFTRVAQIIVRLNLLTLLLAYTMNTDYLSYYFAPLVSWWFLIIYGTMVIGSQYNDRTVFLVCKILFSMGLVTWFMSESWLLENIFTFLERACGIHSSAREWAFRVNLDLWIVYFGMFTAIAVMKIREHRLTDHPQWPLVVKGAAGASGIVLLWFFAFELYQPDKFAYNLWHPYIAFLPVGAFVILRNANGILRSASSRAFAFIGQCSLETFIIQYHFWLAGDTKGVLLVIPGTRWRPLNLVITTIMFIYVSHRVAQATGEVTNWICGSSKPPTLPTIMGAEQRRGHANSTNVESIPLTLQDSEGRKDIDGSTPSLESDSARSPRRWVDRLAEGSSNSSSSITPGFRVWYGETEWKPGVKTKLTIAVTIMWLLNIMWPYPS